MYEVIIIGGGPAGLSACVYAARKHLKTLLISSDFGGQMNWTLNIENYLGYQFINSQELIKKFEEQVAQFPVEKKIGYRITNIINENGTFQVELDNGEKFESLTVIFATGKKPKRLEVPGEIEYTGKGVSYCSICDGPIFAGQKVAVVGGGNSAIQAALDMVKIASHVYLVSSTKLTADFILIDKLNSSKNLSVFIEHNAVKITGKQFVAGLEIKSHQGKILRLDVTGIFIEIGLNPNTEILNGLVKLNQLKEIPVNCLNQTEVPGFFAAGDVTDVPEKQILISAGEGAKAALQAHHYIQRYSA